MEWVMRAITAPQYRIGARFVVTLRPNSGKRCFIFSKTDWGQIHFSSFFFIILRPHFRTQKNTVSDLNRASYSASKSQLCHMYSPRKQSTFRDFTTGFPTKWRLSNDWRNSILMTRHYPDLGSVSDWLKKISLSRSKTNHQKHYQDLASERHQYGFSAVVAQTVVASRNVGW